MPFDFAQGIVSEIESMIFGLKLFGKKKRDSDKAISEHKMELLVKTGRDQFKRLIERGINVPVALL